LRSTRSILSVRFTGVGRPTSVRRAVGGFLRYIQQNDHHWTNEKPGGIEGFLRYAAHRDRTKPQGRLFGAQGDVGDYERRQLGRFVTRSVEGRSAGRAYYRLIISPEDARGLDVRKVTRSVMAQLARDAGAGGLPPWIGAEHRNTAHPHVHVVMAANRLLPDGRYRALVINRERLARMKIAMSREIYRERGHEREFDDREVGRSSADSRYEPGDSPPTLVADRLASPYEDRVRHPLSLAINLGAALRRVGRRYRRHVEIEHEREQRAKEFERLRGQRQRGHEMEMDR
jgi:hypothetical protein